MKMKKFIQNFHYDAKLSSSRDVGFLKTERKFIKQKSDVHIAPNIDIGKEDTLQAELDKESK